jgi:hypothetical protein
MSSAIPFHHLISSYSDDKLINLEVEQFQKLKDFYQVYKKQLLNNEITNLSNPFYWSFICEINHDLLTIRDIMYARNLDIPERQIAIFTLMINDLIFDKGLPKKEVV